MNNDELQLDIPSELQISPIPRDNTIDHSLCQSEDYHHLMIFPSSIKSDYNNRYLNIKESVISK